MSRRFFSNTAVPVALTAGINTSATSLPVTSTAGFPTPPFVLGLERGATDEEICLCTAVPDSTHFTVTRAYDGTTAKAHLINKPVEHCVAAIDYDEANAHVNDSAMHQQAPTGAGMEFWGAESAVPTGWLLCDGRAVSRATYATLHTLLKDAGGVGTYVYGSGDGTTTFNLPDKRGRVTLSKDNMGGSSANRVVSAQADLMGGVAGVETVTLSTAEMPVHTHVQNAHTHVQNPHHHAPAGLGTFYQQSSGTVDLLTQGGGSSYLNATTTADTTAINQNTTAVNQNAGGGAAHNNMPPYIAANYIIKY